MQTLDSVIAEVVRVKHASEELSQMASFASQDLLRRSQEIAAYASASRTGREAMLAVNQASRSLADAASSIKALGRKCDTCASELTK